MLTVAWLQKRATVIAMIALFISALSFLIVTEDQVQRPTDAVKASVVQEAQADVTPPQS